MKKFFECGQPWLKVYPNLKKIFIPLNFLKFNLDTTYWGNSSRNEDFEESGTSGDRKAGNEEV